MNKVHNVSFGKIYTSKQLIKLASEDNSIKRQSENIKKLLRKNNLHKTKYTDVILHYNKYEGFYGIISSKKQGVPMNPMYRSPQILKEKLGRFKDWLKEWEYSYNPKTIAKMKQLQALAIESMKKKDIKF